MKLSKKNRLLRDMLFGVLIVQPLMWEMFNLPLLRHLPIEFRVGALIFSDLMAIIWFLQCRTPDKTEVKPKWW
jgi:hypothetical protein